MRTSNLCIVVLCMLLSCLEGVAQGRSVPIKWYEGKSEFRESCIDKDGSLIDSYTLMGHDTVNVVDVGVEGNYNLTMYGTLHNFHGNSYKRHTVHYTDENGKVKRKRVLDRPVYGWVWGMKDMQHYNALWLRSYPKDDYVYMNDVLEYCVVTVNGNDTTYHTEWQSYLYDESTSIWHDFWIWIEHCDNSVWIGGGYNLDIPWCIIHNIELYGPYTGLYLSGGAKVRVSETFIFAEDKDDLPITPWNYELLHYYFQNEITSSIEGFWELTLDVRKNKDVKMGGNYKLGIVAAGNYYCIIYLDGSEVYPNNWSEGKIKGLMLPNNSGLYDVLWYDAAGNRMGNIEAYLHKNELVFNFIDDKTSLYFSRSRIIDNTPGENRIEEGEEDAPKEAYCKGSGFAISSDGYIVTNNHVIDECTHFYVGNEHMPHDYKAVVVATDTVNDLAILKIEDENFTTMDELPYCLDNRTPRKGETLFSLSYPRPSILGYELKTSSGVVTAINGLRPSDYTISVEIDSGSSGGPIFDEQGNVVGVVVSKMAEGLTTITSNYAIKMSHVHALIEEVSDVEAPQSNRVDGMSHPDMIEALSPYVFYILGFDPK